MSDMVRSVCVFCGSAAGNGAEYAESARRVGKALAERELELVYGAGHVGLMGILADAVLEAGGRVIGVIPQGLEERELAHRRLTELHVVGSMHERKALMADRAGAFLTLPGGYGTLDETFEILTWAQLGLHAKPIAMLNVAGFFDPLLAWIRHAAVEGFVKQKYLALLHVAADIDPLLDALTR